MLDISFYDNIADSLFKFTVIVARYNNQWVFCKHKQRDTYEIPGGHREEGESILETAKRELYEETGAKLYDIRELSPYSVLEDDIETFGMLYFAEIYSFEQLPDSEMELIIFTNDVPEKLTYPTLYPCMIKKYLKEKNKTL